MLLERTVWLELELELRTTCWPEEPLLAARVPCCAEELLREICCAPLRVELELERETEELEREAEELEREAEELEREAEELERVEELELLRVA